MAPPRPSRRAAQGTHRWGTTYPRHRAWSDLDWIAYPAPVRAADGAPASTIRVGQWSKLTMLHLGCECDLDRDDQLRATFPAEQLWRQGPGRGGDAAGSAGRRRTVDGYAAGVAMRTVWLWCSATAATPADVDRWWQSFLRRFDLETSKPQCCHICGSMASRPSPSGSTLMLAC